MKRNPSMVVEILRDWYFIDSVLLNNHAKHTITEEKDYNEYISLKAALLSNLQEFYSHIGYKPANGIPGDHRKLQISAKDEAIQSKAVAARMLENKDMLNHMKSVIKEQFEKNPNANLTEVSDGVLHKRFSKMCLDNTLVGVPMLTCENSNNTLDFRGEILEQSYLTIRSQLISICEKYK
jgi:hypothetical protein